MGISIADLGTAILAPFGDGELTPSFGMSCTPIRISPSTTTTVTFIGVSTHWLSASPILTHSGVTGVTNGAVAVIDDTHFTVDVTTGTATGTLAWADARYGITTAQAVAQRSAGGSSQIVFGMGIY